MTRRSASMSEAILQQHVVKLLDAYGRYDIEWHMVPNGVVLPWKVARELVAMGLKKGVGDLMLLVDRQSFALELKTEVGTQSNDQSEWQERFERAGGIYLIAFGLDQAIGVLQGINAFRAGISFALGKGARSGEVLAKAEPPRNPVTREARAPA